MVFFGYQESLVSNIFHPSQIIHHWPAIFSRFMRNIPKAINLVSTRCTDGDHAALQSWYNDHAQLLMASPELESAELFRLTKTTAAIDYFCLYHFKKLGDFSSFDSSAVMGQARDLSQAAAGRESIEIVKRVQYERLLYRRWAAGDSSFVQASLLRIQGSLRGNLHGDLHDSLPHATRWLNGVIYQMQANNPLQLAQVYAVDAGDGIELFAVLQSPKPLPQNWHASDSPYAPRPSIELQWQARAERVAQWLR